ncbi:MAG: hypothetical protein ACK56F_04790, partial [bacterium]
VKSGPVRVASSSWILFLSKIGETGIAGESMSYSFLNCFLLSVGFSDKVNFAPKVFSLIKGVCWMASFVI